LSTWQKGCGGSKSAHGTCSSQHGTTINRIFCIAHLDPPAYFDLYEVSAYPRLAVARRQLP
jgi:hypothetical protein